MEKSEPTTRQLIVKLYGIVLLVGVFEVVLVVGVARTPTSLTSGPGHVEPDGLVRVEDGVVPAPVTEVQADVDHTGKGVGVPEIMAGRAAVLRCDFQVPSIIEVWGIPVLAKTST